MRQGGMGLVRGRVDVCGRVALAWCEAGWMCAVGWHWLGARQGGLVGWLVMELVPLLQSSCHVELSLCQSVGSCLHVVVKIFACSLGFHLLSSSFSLSLPSSSSIL